MTDIVWTCPGFQPTMLKCVLCIRVWLCSDVVIGVAIELLWCDVSYGVGITYPCYVQAQK